MTDRAPASAPGREPPDREPARALARECHRLLLELGATVGTAESLTGGLLGAALTSEPGTSATYRGGVVAYAVELKAELLGVDRRALERDGPVHPDTAVAMAAGACGLLAATYGLATTGVAGPEAHGGRPVGAVYVAIAGPAPGGEGPMPLVRQLGLPGGRDRIRHGTVAAALELLRDVLVAAGRATG